MPVYRSTGVAVSLLSSPLDLKATAFGSRNKPVDTEPTSPQDKCCIYERPLLDEDNPGPLRFIGPANDIPFFLTRAIDRQPDVHPDHGPTTHNFLKSAFQPARCLSLDVDMSKCHFTWTKDQHAKIEVFYNGTLAACRAIKLVKSAGGKNQVDSKQDFSGRRVGLRIERPFVIAPVLWTDTLQQQGTLADAEVWASVGSSLHEEAEARGRNKHGHISPSSECLVALSSLPLPSFGPDLKRHIDRHMGIIDVIVSLGTSKKETTSYAINGKPTRLPDPAFQPLTQELPESKSLGRKGYNAPRLPTTRQSLPNPTSQGSRDSKMQKATKIKKSKIVRLKVAAIQRNKDSQGHTEPRERPTQPPTRLTTPTSNLFADPGILVRGSTIAPLPASGADDPWIYRTPSAMPLPPPLTSLTGGNPDTMAVNRSPAMQPQQTVPPRSLAAAKQREIPIQAARPSMPTFGPRSPSMQDPRLQSPIHGWRPIAQEGPSVGFAAHADTTSLGQQPQFGASGWQLLAQNTVGLRPPSIHPPPSQFQAYPPRNPPFDPHSITPHRAVVAPATPSRPEKNESVNTGAQFADNDNPWIPQASPALRQSGLSLGPLTSIPVPEPTQRARRGRPRNTSDDKSGAEVDWCGSALDRGSVFTYAEPWMCPVDHSDAGLQAHLKPNSTVAAESMEVVRPTPRERPGEFREHSILVVVRYVMI